MQKIKDFLATPLGKKVEKYMWEVLVLTIALIVTAGAELNISYLIAITPILNQITKFLNTEYLK
jgi:hypothetical protein